jgi:hypothetical protein
MSARDPGDRDEEERAAEASEVARAAVSPSKRAPAVSVEVP